MVHYGHDCHSVQPLPPSCPKCGSHRTQVVGRSDDSRTVMVRCSACGESSRVVVGEDSNNDINRGHTPAVRMPFDDVAIENEIR